MGLVQVWRRGVIMVVLAHAAGCGGSGSSATPDSGVTADAPVAGATPFIATVELHGAALARTASISYAISPAPGSVSKAVQVSYSMAYLVGRGFAAQGATQVVLPVFGLYAGATNAVNLTVTFADGSSTQLPLTIATAAWDHPILSHPAILKARPAGTSLGWDFMFLKSALGSIAIVDTDGAVRWYGPEVSQTLTSTFYDGRIFMGSVDSRQIHQVWLDGATDDSVSMQSTTTVGPNHDFEPGKTGILSIVNSIIDGETEVGSISQEFAEDGTVVAQWNLGDILSAAMSAGGDDPTQFVRPPHDWCHMNTSIYDGRDDSVILSCREDFVIKLDYATGAIRWILGDPTKYWFTFPSLRALSLTMIGPGLPPEGQHALSIAPDGDLLLFNNEMGSVNQPPGAPVGTTVPYSTVESYAIDEVARTATESWRFDNGEALKSRICSSAREMPDGSVLVDFAAADDDTSAYLLGLDAGHDVVFDFRYASSNCKTAWYAVPFALEAMEFR